MPSSHRDRLEETLHRIETAAHPAFVGLYLEAARAAADAADARARDGRPLGPLDGMIVPVKDLFDVAGDRTVAGAALRAEAPPAARDAAAVARLREAGAVVLGRTHMSEFAFSGLGLNRSVPTLGNALDQARIPGGSSSGAAVAVAEGLADAALGSDTGGSCRIPAALNGVVGFKPSHGATPSDGCFPLAPSLDCVGPLGPDVAVCAAVFAAIADEPAPVVPRPSADAMTLGVLRGAFIEQADADIVDAYEATLSQLSAAGAALIPLDLDAEWRDMLAAFPAPLVTIEAAAVHQRALREERDAFDPRIAARIALGADATAADYINGLDRRRALIAAAADKIAAFDAVLSPTVPIRAPEIAVLDADDDAYFRANGLMLRNPTFANLFDLCALSLPLPLGDGASAGVSVSAPKGADARLLALGATIEASL